jgi:F-type H+-transporting ATPase subunit b
MPHVAHVAPGAWLAAAAGSEHPLIDIDLTVLVQLAIFVAVGILASRALFRPYLRLREERSAGIEGAREEAARMTAQADAQLADYQSKLARARIRAEEERRKMRAEAAAHERQTLEGARGKAVAALDSARESITSQTAAARRELTPQADEIARKLAAKLLGREVG